MSEDQDRRAELIAGAVAGDLDDAERRELAALAEADPSILVDVAELSAIASDLSSVGRWDQPTPGVDLRERVLGAVGAEGERYEVVLVGRDGRDYDSGTFLGSDVTIACRMNAALLRQQVADVEIRDDSGAVVSAAHPPSVS